MEQQAQLSPRLSVSPNTRLPWLASCLLHRQVVNVTTLEPVGRVADVTFDPMRSQLTGITVQLNTPPQSLVATIGRVFGRSYDTGAIGVEHIVALNGDVVMVDADPTRLPSSQPLEPLFHLNEVCELAILTTYGMCLGSLADLLLDYRGGDILGYVVKPTEVAGSLLPLLDDFAHPEPLPSQVMSLEIGLPEAASAPDAPPSHLRVIPATSQVRFGDSLILLVAEVEPLPRQVVIITRQAEEHTDLGSASG